MQSTPQSRTLTNQTFFVTASLGDRARYFAEEDAANVVLETLQFFRTRGEMDMFAYVIMPDHVHLIVNLHGELTLPDLMRRFKSFVARNIGKGPIWQKGYWSQAIPNERIFLQKLNYIHGNPVEKGLADTAESYSYSSAREYFDGIFRWADPYRS